ncbi:Uncharacterised protein [Tatumella ptyseos]|nr:Uncharacterised protein [Tatumella ptyseos]
MQVIRKNEVFTILREFSLPFNLPVKAAGSRTAESDAGGLFL